MRYINTSILTLLTSLIFSGYQIKPDYRKIHSDAVVIDTHNDVVQRILKGEDISKRTLIGHSDLVRMKEGGIDVQVFSIWVPPQKKNNSYFDQAVQQIDSLENLVRRNPALVSLAGNSADIEKIAKEGKIAVMLGLEGGHPIEDDLKKIEYFYRRGVRYMTLTWNNSTSWATSARDEENMAEKPGSKGLSELGKRVIKKMNDIGMIIDVSHLGEKAFWDVIRTARKPVIASHSSVWALSHSRRNLKDDQIKAIAEKGGVVFINFLPLFIDSTYAEKEKKIREKNKKGIDSLLLTKAPISAEEFLRDEYNQIRPPLDRLISHFEYVARLVGADHVGIGSDFDGISTTPREMDDVTFLPNITRELLRLGYSEEDVKKILGGNFIRILKDVEMR